MSTSDAGTILCRTSDFSIRTNKVIPALPPQLHIVLRTPVEHLQAAVATTHLGPAISNDPAARRQPTLRRTGLGEKAYTDTHSLTVSPPCYTLLLISLSGCTVQGCDGHACLPCSFNLSAGGRCSEVFAPDVQVVQQNAAAGS